MSEEQLFVFGTFFLGKEMIRVQINYSYEISRSTVMNHWVRQQQKYGVQDYTFGQMKHLRIMHYYYYELPFNIEIPFSKSIHPPKMTVRDIQ